MNKTKDEEREYTVEDWRSDVILDRLLRNSLWVDAICSDLNKVGESVMLLPRQEGRCRGDIITKLYWRKWMYSTQRIARNSWGERCMGECGRGWSWGVVRGSVCRFWSRAWVYLKKWGEDLNRQFFIYSLYIYIYKNDSLWCVIETSTTL